MARPRYYGYMTLKKFLVQPSSIFAASNSVFFADIFQVLRPLFFVSCVNTLAVFTWVLWVSETLHRCDPSPSFIEKQVQKQTGRKNLLMLAAEELPVNKFPVK
jgi:hypothetical protein